MDRYEYVRGLSPNGYEMFLNFLVLLILVVCFVNSFMMFGNLTSVVLHSYDV